MKSKVAINRSGKRITMAATLRQLRAFCPPPRAQLHARRGGDAPVAAGLQRPDRRLEEHARRAPVRPQQAHVAPTAEGAAFEAAAARVLAEFETALAGVRDRAAQRRGRVSLALLPSLAAGWLPAVLARFRASYPGITSTSPTCCRSRASSASGRGAPTSRSPPCAPRRRAAGRIALLRRRLPPRLPRRPSARDRARDPAARPRRLALHPPVADEQRAPVPRRRLPSAGDAAR